MECHNTQKNTYIHCHKEGKGQADSTDTIKITPFFFLYDEN